MIRPQSVAVLPTFLARVGTTKGLVFVYAIPCTQTRSKEPCWQSSTAVFFFLVSRKSSSFEQVSCLFKWIFQRNCIHLSEETSLHTVRRILPWVLPLLPSWCRSLRSRSDWNLWKDVKGNKTWCSHVHGWRHTCMECDCLRCKWHTQNNGQEKETSN